MGTESSVSLSGGNRRAVSNQVTARQIKPKHRISKGIRMDRISTHAVRPMVMMAFLFSVPMTAIGQESSPPPGMALVPAGAFDMGIEEADLAFLAEMGRGVPHMSETHSRWWFGDEVARHRVEVEAFWLDSCEVTNGEFRRFVEETGYDVQGDWEEFAGPGRDQHPVVSVTWNDACAYAEWAGKRLPTEEEWEYAARGGADVKWYPWGDAPDPSAANYRHEGETFFEGLGRLVFGQGIETAPVGSYPSNGYGLLDIIGNVSEWTASRYGPYPGRPAEDWVYTRHGPFRRDEPMVDGYVARGGSWQSPDPVFVRLTHRTGFQPSSCDRTMGFRCAMDAE